MNFKSGAVEEGTYENGVKNGEWVVLDQNGNKIKTETWKNGVWIEE